jgi:tetratricopeptide (TPR) repeat protein
LRGLSHSLKNIAIRTALLLLILHAGVLLYGQYGFSFDIKKPKEFENRVLGSEKPQKKFSVPRRFLQNTVTHYNYFFNANVKLNNVLARAKQTFREDYTQLLPFYNYTLDATMADSVELDSISYKAQTGIVLHDLRNDWVDDMYLLWGITYYLKQQHDSAYLMFQFINYAFAPKEKDGYYLTIGSARDGNSATSISTKEKKGLVRNLLSDPPSRNETFIWQIRNYLAQEKYAEASSLILALRNDSIFPARLHNDLAEVQALYYYRQSNWDSAAAYLEKALSNAGNLQERARWEYLLGQLYERGRSNEQATNFYEKAIQHTTDPIMDVYARLALVRVNKDEKENTIDNNIASLLKMARRDKYYDYRDIIYFMAAQMELERNNLPAAIQLLEKSTRYTSNNPTQRNKAFLQLAELSFRERNYRESLRYYDSVQLNDQSLPDPEAIAARKSTLTSVVADLNILQRQDSLQKLAALPEDERREIVRKLLRQLRRERGLKDEVTTTGRARNDKNDPPSLFSDNAKGEWYFYNSALRQKGQNDFRSRWGNRPNTDNWRRSDVQSGARTSNNVAGVSNTGSANAAADADISYESLIEQIPLTEEKMKQSNDSVMNAMYSLGVALIQELEDCKAGTDTLVALQSRFPEFAKMDQVLFNIYYCYQKTGEKTRAAAVKKIMADQYSHSNFTAIVTTGKDPQGKSRQDEATRTYEQIYDQFLEGRFAEAIANKRKADSTYGQNFWTPQLLYIEAVYYIRQRNDSTATRVLQNIINQFSGQPLAEKATVMLDVLSRRAEIEEELRNMVIEMPAEDSSSLAAAPVTRTKAPDIVIDNRQSAPPVVDSVAQLSTVKLPEPKLQKPDVTAVGDSSSTRTLRDTTSTRILPGADAPKAVVQANPEAYFYDSKVPHYVVLVLNKIDPIFVGEARNAFYRFNRNEYYNKTMEAELLELNTEDRLLLISPFATAEEALAYVDKTRPRTASEILPWLRGGKYSFLIISDRNLELLKAKKEVQAYRDFLDLNLPGKF